jgi:hypothetical protein
MGENGRERGDDEVTPKVTPKKGRKRVRDWRPAFLHHLGAWGNVSRAAKKAKIARKTAYAAREKDPQFKSEWDDALKTACDGMEEEARRRAVEGSKKPIYFNGKVVGHARDYSDVLLIFLLKAHHPEKYRENMRNENWNIDPKDWTDAQIEAYRAGVPLARVLTMRGDSADRAD